MARRDWIHWITSARQPETRALRIKNAFTEGNEDSEEAAELDLFANTFVYFVAFCEDFWREKKETTLNYLSAFPSAALRCLKLALGQSLLVS